MPKYEEIREEIAQKIAFTHGYTFPSDNPETDDVFLWHADQILAIKVGDKTLKELIEAQNG